MNELIEKGGAKIGWANASWPFAKLHVTDKTLSINATILGNFIFNKSDIISIEAYSKFGIFMSGIKINHTVQQYNKIVIFWTFKDPEELIRSIRQTGFFDKNEITDPIEEISIKNNQQQGGFPLKISFAIAIILLWNLLSFIDLEHLVNKKQFQFGFGKGFILSTGIMIIICILLLFNKPFQRLSMKEGKTINDIRIFIYFILLIVSILFISKTVIFL
jgi:hypothetical protein